MSTRKKKLDLSTFDGRLLDGLNFCKNVYALFDQMRAEPDGITKLRISREKPVKRLLEELMPLARYVQARYREGRRIKVRWLSGSQPFDAILLSSGLLVEKGYEPRKVFVEITTSVHENDHLSRQLLQKQGYSFGPKGISRDEHTGTILSKPYCYINQEKETDLAAQIIQRIKIKTEKGYPPDTVLIVFCIPPGILLQDGWEEVVRQVRAANTEVAFREVFLIDINSDYCSATLYGARKNAPEQH